ncbi:Tetratricopeptide repeat protein [Rubripirellula lacrimiformis]|uniref:Tetratricopeptide repeat protein n=1 Tax=Rubripirellula lacrimiformis TaxID=1930273 RepID=A0A517N931_9BACT|nr:Tetratricopeptide repeat protein [Rubripirellula lacrimiformis]
MALVAGAAILLLAGGVFADYWSARPPETVATYVGRAACIDCHQEESLAFTGSDHDKAMDLATDETVLGDFDDATLDHDGMTSRMFRDGKRFMVRTDGPSGEMEDFEVKYVFGVEPLQQYMVEFDRTDDMSPNEVPRLQVLRISWDTINKRWFYLRPPDVDDKLLPDDPLHWTGIAQRWQTMCADCHSTNLKSNFDPVTTKYHTTFSEIDVSCEACHGPGSLHVELANAKSLFWDRNHGYGLARLKGPDAEPQLQSCAPCHSRRSLLDDQFKPGDMYTDHYNLELLRADTYHADGQIKDEVYVYGSFIQSRMHHKGIRCTDCHDPHTLKLKSTGNETCTSCHQHAAGKYDVPSHHHHAVGTPGAMCVNCHMPHTTYMDVDKRRDHSIRVPRPDLSVELGTPNACSQCHVADQLKSLDTKRQTEFATKEYADWILAAQAGDESVADAILRTDTWCDEACDRWYGDSRKQPDHFGQAITAFRRGEPDSVAGMLRLAMMPTETPQGQLTPDMARASALAEMASSGAAEAIPTAKKLLDDPDQPPMVRAAAAGVFLIASPEAARRALQPHLQDPSRLVRTEVVRVLVASGGYQTLTGAEQLRVDQGLEEVREGMMMAGDRAGAHMAWAMLCEATGRYDEAIKAYEAAIRVEPNTTGPRSNLATLIENLAQQSQSPNSVSMLQRVGELRAAELPFLKRDANLAPDNAAVQYRFGLSLYLAGQFDEALDQIELAIELAPDVAEFRQARDLLKAKLAE